MLRRASLLAASMPRIMATKPGASVAPSVPATSRGILSAAPSVPATSRGILSAAPSSFLSSCAPASAPLRLAAPRALGRPGLAASASASSPRVRPGAVRLAGSVEAFGPSSARAVFGMACPGAQRRWIAGSASGGAAQTLPEAEASSAHPPALTAAVSRPGFRLLRAEHVPEYAADAFEYEHERSGARILSLTCRDENKAFGVAFRTPVSDSRGTPHVLEHSVLCGSAKYPVKEPFVELMKGSVHTFLNAFTYPDRTVYPVASTNEADFRNLVSVYLDAVFEPRAVRDPDVLKQEGWHYELANAAGGQPAAAADGAVADGAAGESSSSSAPAAAASPSSALTIQGVVYNEMKGVYSSPDSVAGRQVHELLHPDSSYRHDSGGSPSQIPSMTHASFKAFYDAHYRPDNALFCFWGDDDPAWRLEAIEEYLDARPRRDPKDVPVVDAQPLWTAPRTLRTTYPAADADEEAAAEAGAEAAAEAAGSAAASSPSGKSFVTVSWILDAGRLDPQTELELGFLSHLLLGTRAAPLRRALDESGLGESIIGGGLDDSGRQPTFSVGLKGVRAEDAAKVEKVVLDALEKAASEPFAPTAVEAAINTVEFALRENNTGSFPRGLAASLRSICAWNYGDDCLRALRWSEDLEAVSRTIRDDPAKLGELVRARLLDNPHRLTHSADPETGGSARVARQEAEALAAKLGTLSEAERRAIAEEADRLKAKQAAPDPEEALATVPGITLADLPVEAKTTPHVVKTRSQVLLEGALAPKAGGSPAAAAPSASPASSASPAIPMGFVPGSTTSNLAFVETELDTSDILYLDVVLDASGVPARLLPLLPTLCRALTGTGVRGGSFVELSERIGATTGGLSASPLVADAKGAPDAPVARVVLRGKAVSERVGDLAALVGDVLEAPNLGDRERVRQYVSEAKAGLEASLTSSGHAFAASRLEAQRSIAGAAGEALAGYRRLEALREISTRVADDWESVEADLRELLRVLQTGGVRGALIGATGDRVALSAFAKEAPRFAQRLEGFAAEPSPEQRYPGWAELQSEFRPGNEVLLVPTLVNYVAKAANLYEDRSPPYELHGSSHVAARHLGASWLWDAVRVRGGAYGAFASWDSVSGQFTYSSYRDPRLVDTLKAYDASAEFLASLDASPRELERAIIGTLADLDAYQLPDARGWSVLMRRLIGITDEDRQKRRDQIRSTTLDDLHAFGRVLDTVSQEGRVAAVASQDALDAARKEQPGLFDRVIRAL